MVSIAIEPMVRGRCYSRHEDGAEITWATVLDWNPPHRLLLAWQVTHDFCHQSDLDHASEVDVRFTAVSADLTRVELEHRRLERHGAHAAAMRAILDGTNGWSVVLQGYSSRIGTDSAAPSRTRT